MKTFTLAVLLGALACPASALVGTVTHVSDGDTLWIRLDEPSAGPAGSRKPVKVRLLGIDAPEICQAWGPEAKAALEARVLHRQVRLKVRAADTYHRSIGTLELNGQDVSAWMVDHGHAWSARFRRSGGAYAAQERAAREARRGLFRDAGAIDPRIFRKSHGPCL